jgi:hypothetical protein
MAALGGEDRERAFAAAEVATLLDLRRALRNGTEWIEHNLAFRSRETLLDTRIEVSVERRFVSHSRISHEGRSSLSRLTITGWRDVSGDGGASIARAGAVVVIDQ